MSGAIPRPLLRLARSSAGGQGSLADPPDLLVDALEQLAQAPDPVVDPILPLALRGAVAHGLWDRLDPSSGRALDHRRLELVARVAHQRRWLERLLPRLESTGIGAVLLKGVGFDRALYPLDAPRVGGDIDLLVRGRDFDAVCSIVEALAAPAHSYRDRQVSRSRGYERLFLTGGPLGTLVEVHRALTVPDVFLIDHDALIERARPHPGLDAPAARILDPEDTLLHLAVHAFRHLRVENHALLDVHEVFTQWQPDASVLLERAGAWGARSALYRLLESAREVCRTLVPVDLLEQLRPGAMRDELSRRVYRFASERELRLPDPGYRLTQLASLAAVPDRPAGVLRFGLRYAGWRALDLWAWFRSGS
jgi:hypothetical protein